VIEDLAFGGSSAETLTSHSASEANGNGILIPCYTFSPTSGEVSEPSRGSSDIWLARIDRNQNLIWNRRFGSSGGELTFSIAPAADGGFLVCGATDGPLSHDLAYAPINPANANLDWWLLRLDANGDTLWTRRLGGDYTERCWASCQMPDGGWVVAGETASPRSGNISEHPRGWTPGDESWGNDGWIVRLNDQGNIMWERRLGGSGDDNLRHLLPLPDGGLLVSGESGSLPDFDRQAPNLGWRDGWIVKLDASGNILWDKAFGAPEGDTRINHILRIQPAGFLLTCQSNSSAGPMKSEPSRGGLDAWLIQTDDSFNPIWEKTIGGGNQDILNRSMQVSSGAVYLGGSTASPAAPASVDAERRSPNRGGTDMWFIKLVPEQPFALRDTDIKGQRLERSARITFAPQPVDVVDVLVERTQDLSSRPVRFQTIAQIETGQVCGTAECQWLDREPLPGSNFYRLAYRLSDGSRVYSNIVQLTFESHQSPEVIDFRLYPNPTQGPVHLDFQSRLAGQARLELFSTDGRAVHTRTLDLERGANAFDLELDLPTGVYLMRLNLPDGTAVRERMLVR